MIKTMRNGSVIIDLAASTGGNTELTKNDLSVCVHGVTIIGHSRLPSTLPGDASKMYGKNILNFLQLMISKDGSFNLNMNDELVKGTCVAHGGELLK
jgi:NAD(P) transhydrogenase subunit alpha